MRRYGAKPREDLEQLWRRIVFEVLINNTDDHLRNHGFLYQDATGWVLSPAYDLNPMPVDLAPRALTTAIDLDDPTASLKLVLSTAGDYGINKERGVAVIQEVVAALEGWAAVAKSCGLNNNKIERMRSAFEHPERMLKRAPPQKSPRPDFIQLQKFCTARIEPMHGLQTATGLSSGAHEATGLSAAAKIGVRKVYASELWVRPGSEMELNVQAGVVKAPERGALIWLTFTPQSGPACVVQGAGGHRLLAPPWPRERS